MEAVKGDVRRVAARPCGRNAGTCLPGRRSDERTDSTSGACYLELRAIHGLVPSALRDIAERRFEARAIGRAPILAWVSEIGELSASDAGRVA